MWAMANDVWGRDVADDLLHAFAALNFGKTSLKSLTREELNQTLEWLKATIDASE